MTDVEWQTPMDVLVIENPAATLLPLSEVKDRIRNQLQIEYTLGRAADYNEEIEASAAEVRISNIVCGLARIQVPEREGEFYYIPAWGIYGDVGVDYGKGIQFWEEGEDGEKLMLVLNALDGSVINVTRGY